MLDQLFYLEPSRTLTRAATPQMPPGASIVAVGSGHALAVIPQTSTIASQLPRAVGVQRAAAHGGADLVERLAIARQEVRGEVIKSWDVGRTPTAGVVAFRRFEFDHVGAEIGQRHAAPGTGQHAAQVEHADMRQRSSM